MSGTMKLGISLYPGLDNSPEENLELLRQAAELGYTRVFTSLQIPESDPERLHQEADDLFTTAEEAGMEIISDVSPATCEILRLEELTPKALRRHHIHRVRFDFGIPVETIAAFSREMPVQLNASTIRADFLESLRKAGADFGNIDALHNFYPRPHTGLAEDFLLRQNLLLEKYGIRTGAFIPGSLRKRSPLREGLPTLERHRREKPETALEELAGLKTDSAFFSDSLPTPKELTIVSERNSATSHILPLDVSGNLLSSDSEAPISEVILPVSITSPFLSHLLDRKLFNRKDKAAEVIRVEEARNLLKSEMILPEHTGVGILPPGTIILDNENYGRYKGEMQILLRPLPADARSNIAGRVREDCLDRLPLIANGTPFRFIPAD